MNKIIERILIIWYCLAEMGAGLVGVLSLGFYIPKWNLKAVIILTRYRELGRIRKQRK